MIRASSNIAGMMSSGTEAHHDNAYHDGKHLKAAQPVSMKRLSSDPMDRSEQSRAHLPR